MFTATSTRVANMPEPPDGESNPQPLRFNVAPHLVQDLGLNLYTNLPKVLVEFVANAYDADSPIVDIQMNFDDIEYQRGLVKLQGEKDKRAAAGNLAALTSIVPLAQRVLPPTVAVKIIDRGCGMSRDDLATQFHIAGRRRREEGGGTTTTTSGRRLLMGRKGVGKLAGFGVAHKVTITTRKKDELHATRIVLDFHEIGKYRTTNDIVIPDDVIADG
ncbi:MAG: ATP-binding protein, partial [Fimbriiglobus sp.]